MVGVPPRGSSVNSSMVKDSRVPSGRSMSLSDDKECDDELLTLFLDRSSTSSVSTCSPSRSCDLTDVLSPNTVVSLVEAVLGVLPSPMLGFGVCCLRLRSVLETSRSPVLWVGVGRLFRVFGFRFHVLLFLLPILTLSPSVEARSGVLSVRNGCCLELSLIYAEVRDDLD